MNMAFRGLNNAQYEWRAFGQPLGSSTTVPVVESARPRIILDSQLTLSPRVAALCRAGYYQLQQLRPLVQSMTAEAARTVAAAFISCWLDYCNSLLLHGLPDTTAQVAVCVERHCTTDHWHATS